MRSSLFALLLVLGVAAPRPSQAQDSTGPAAFVITGPQQGDRAPDFSLPWATGDTVSGETWFSLSGQRGRVVVLAFYPHDFAQQSTEQMQIFAARSVELFGPEVVVVGVGPDSIESHRRFAASLSLPFKLLTDADLAVARRYGSATKDGSVRRTVFVLDTRGAVSYADYYFNARGSKSYDRLKSAVRLALHAR